MPTKQRRYSLKTRESKQIIEETTRTLKIDLETLFGEKINIEIINSDVGEIFLIDGNPVLVKVANKLLPTLLFTQFVANAPKIVVDMGAVPYVCKGATIMAPGITHIEGEFDIGGLVLVVDIKHGKALAIGESLLDSQTARTTKKGPVVKTLHYVSDKVWDFIKELNR